MEEFRGYSPAFDIVHVSPTPLLMTVMDNDTLMPTDLALAAYANALEPKELHLLPGGHFDAFGKHFDEVAGRQIDFLKRTLLA